MTRTTPELAPPSPDFHATPTGGRLTTTYDLTCNRPHTRRIFSGIGSRTWNPPASTRYLTTRPPRPHDYFSCIRNNLTGSGSSPRLWYFSPISTSL
ncbi:hypothetical protein AVEN_217698-1 [Araneus ventricosus]|uniref:Uncharacterized protein n=1 Tax=Araneus ventricosus TaxID=182803 RepID=A0A4Y2K7K6_ARAVE|nr:hypothetical protein AVEN_217698-1 [Araneus ventricosus]